MLNKKKLGLGLDDFKEIRTSDYYYIDKTKFIEDILLDGANVKLFCRPRRFGKTLNMSTLRYFFDIKNREENRKLFNGLYIENSPMMSEQGQYPVIFLSMKGIEGLNWMDTLNRVKSKIKELYREHTFLMDSLDKYTLMEFEKYLSNEFDGALLKNSLKFLTEVLYKFYKKKVIILIDEYDSPIISSYEKGYYNEAINFFKGFYGDVLKTNEYLQMGVLTGIVRVAQAGIFSDLNNIENYTILNKQYSEYFGLLEDEVEQALKDYDISYKLDEVKSWYDGYRFGENEIYNPLSILKFLGTQELGAYWINTSGNSLIKELLKNSNKKVFDILNNLFEGKETVVYISQNITLGNNLSSDDLWELLLFSGYLTVKERIDMNTYFVRIPNSEIMTEYILELKRLKGRTVEKELDEALNQIKLNRYDALLKRDGINDITNIALVFDRKRMYHKIEK